MTVIQLNRVLCSHGEIPCPSTQIIICKNYGQQLFFLLPLRDTVVILFMSQHGVKQNEITTLYGAVAKNIVHFYDGMRSDTLYICFEDVVLY
jgi:hypothetical protein